MNARNASIRIAAALVVVPLLACGSEPPEVIEPAELAELCGQTEPIRLLQFPAERDIHSGYPLGVFGDRRVLAVNYADTDVASQSLWSVGLCGEAPQRMISGRYYFWTLDGQDWPFVCDYDTGELYVLDPSGERERKLVVTLPVGCHANRTAVGFVSIRPHGQESETGDLVRYPWPDDVWTADEVTPVTLVEDVKTHHGTPFQSQFDTLHGLSDELLFVTANDELVRMALADDSLEVIASGVRTFDVGYDNDDSELGYSLRYLLWQRTELSNDDPLLPEGEILLLDRTTKSLSSLGHSLLTNNGIGAGRWTRSGLVQLRVSTDEGQVLRLFQLPSLSHVDVPVDARLDYMLADDRHLVGELEKDGPRGMLDVQTGELVSFANAFGKHFANGGLGGYWPEQGIYALLLGTGGANSHANSELWLIRGAAEPPELFANRATISHGLMPDGRLLTSLNLNEEALGDLVVVDDFEERLITRGVASFYAGPNLGDDMLTYSIREGERAGIWLARLQPRD